MLTSFKWLRRMGRIDDDVEVQRAADLLTARGLTVDSVEPRGDDHALDIDVPANRPDCLGHLGLARELAAGLQIAPPPTEPRGALESSIADRIAVRIEAPELCSRYTARIVENVRIEPSPAWLAQGLEVCGIRSISNVVDISNYVLLMLANPIHFFDLATIGGAQIVVRRARTGETLSTLDGVERKLTDSMLVIADESRPVALAGVMGGAATEINAETQTVLIEAATFDPVSVRTTSRQLGLLTDASHRFERGVDIESLVAATALATRLLCELAGGRAVDAIVDAHPVPRQPRSLALRPAQIERLLGYAPEADEIHQALDSLQLQPRGAENGTIEIEVPSWRVDLEREADLVEEVARHLGYDRIPRSTHGLPVLESAAGTTGLEEAARDLLSHAGFHEGFGYAMIAGGEDDPFVDPGIRSPIQLSNPIADSLACLRRSILPGLVRAAELNQRRGTQDVRLFEVGHVFLPSEQPGSFPVEPLHAGLAWSGAGTARHWSRDDREVDPFDVFGIVDRLLGQIRPTSTFERAPSNHAALQPGQSAAWLQDDGAWVARAGQLRPELGGKLQFPLYLAEIDLSRLEAIEESTPRYTPLPRLTAVNRDLALVLDGSVSYGNIMNTLQAVEAPATVLLRAVDSYQGPPLAENEISLTLRVTLQPADETLTEDRIEAYRLELVRVLQEQLGIGIRG